MIAIKFMTILLLVFFAGCTSLKMKNSQNEQTIEYISAGYIFHNMPHFENSNRANPTVKSGEEDR